MHSQYLVRCARTAAALSARLAPASLLRCCASLTMCRPAAFPLCVQRRGVSTSYTTAVPCARFDVSTKELARITNQPTLPPTANIYIIDLRKKHISKIKKKPNPRRVMSHIIDAHRAERTKATATATAAAASIGGDVAYSPPPLIFLVKTDDTLKQAARRQQVMEDQLKALGAHGEFHVCVLSGPKSRHWSQYVPVEEEGAETATAASRSSGATTESATAGGAVAAAAGTATVAAAAAAADRMADGAAAFNNTDASSTGDHDQRNTLRDDAAGAHPPVAAGNTKHDPWANAAHHADTKDGAAEGGEEEEEWEEVEEEVEEEEEAARGVEEVSEPHEQQEVPLHASGAVSSGELAGSSPHDAEERALREDTPLPGVAAPPTAFEASTPRATDAGDAVRRRSEGTVPLHFQHHPDAVHTAEDNSSLRTTDRQAVVGEEAGEEGDGAEEAEEEEVEEVEEMEEVVEPPSTPINAAHPAVEKAASTAFSHPALSAQRAEATTAAPETEPPVPVGHATQQAEELLEEFDLDGPITAAATPAATPAAMPAVAGDAASTVRATAPPPPHAHTAASTVLSPSTTVTASESDAVPPVRHVQEPTSQPEAVHPAPSAAEAVEEVEEEVEAVREATSGAPEEASSDPAVEDVEAPTTEAAEVVGTTPDSTTTTESPPPAQEAVPFPEPATPMPVYPEVPARLYTGASTVYLSDRALRELPLTANVLVVDRLDWSDDHIDSIDAALAQVDPVAGHVLLYRDAYAPQSTAVMKENLVFREALVPFVFAFRTRLSRSAAMALQRRFVEVLRSRPAGLSVEQQALLAGQKDRTYVCVLCDEESRTGGENPLEDPELRHRAAAAAAAPKTAKSVQSSPREEEEEEKRPDGERHDVAETAERHSTDTVAATRDRSAAESDSSDALQRLWSMMDVSPSPSSSPVETRKPSQQSATEDVTEDKDRADVSFKPARQTEKRRFSVPVPSYELEDDDLMDGTGANNNRKSSDVDAAGLQGGENDDDASSSSFSVLSSASARRKKNGRGSNQSAYDPSTAPPTSLPPKATAAPLSLGLLGFETVVFGKQNAYSNLHASYRPMGSGGSARYTHGERSGAVESVVEATSGQSHSSDDADDEHHGVDEKKRERSTASETSPRHTAHDAATASSSPSLGFSDADVEEAEQAVLAERKRSTRSAASAPHRSSKGSGAKRRGSRAAPTRKAATAAKTATASANAELQAEDAALEDFIRSLYKDSAVEDSEVLAQSRGSRASKGDGSGASSVASARTAIKSESRRRKSK